MRRAESREIKFYFDAGQVKAQRETTGVRGQRRRRAWSHQGNAIWVDVRQRRQHVRDKCKSCKQAHGCPTRHEAQPGCHGEDGEGHGGDAMRPHVDALVRVVQGACKRDDVSGARIT